MGHALVIEDDEIIAQAICNEIKGKGYRVDWAATGVEGLSKALSEKYEIITIDRRLPDFDGLTIVRAVRDVGVRTPILVISALSDVDERVKGLRGGGDDYLAKPFSIVEMGARLDALLRRPVIIEPQQQLEVGTLKLDLLERKLERSGEVIPLLPTEFKLLTCLMRNVGHCLTRKMLFEEVWGFYFDPGTNIIEVHMSRLRTKIEGEGVPSIFTVRGLGYMLGV